MAMRLLVADADEKLLDQCEAYSSQQGVVLQTARGGVECVAALRRRPPDVLVLDAELPWGGGDGVLTLMCEDDSLARVPVVLLGSDAGAGVDLGRFSANVVGRLVKPLDAATIFDSAASAADCGEFFSRRASLQRPFFGRSARDATGRQDFAGR